MPELPGLWSLSPIGALLGGIILFYWLLATGRIITRSSHERELAQANKRGDEWKETALDTRKLNNELASQNGKLVDGNSIAEHFFRTANPATMGDTLPRPPGGTDVVA
ncbi:hypothetical protein [Herbiconiux sp. UC225_62]|uniref:hypothetical protein n=1 Tax=Herbiconiux sp. UC225_62 TaxID=3350168 RepID=UPI0036D2D679